MKTIEVRRVFERNDCAGKRYIYVTSMEEEDETAASRYRLTSLSMNPYDKIILASVAPTDVVEVVTDVWSPDLLNAGEFTGIVPQHSNQDPKGLCRCGTFLISDGIDVYCPNQECFLTVAARIERLSQTVFFSPELNYVDETLPHWNLIITPNGAVNYYQPFSMIATGEFWNYPSGTLEHILQARSDGLPNLANFLNETLWEELLEKVGPQDILDSQAYIYVQSYFSFMREISNRRDVESDVQNHLLSGFLWALGLESVNQFVIQKLMQYERTVGSNCQTNPFLVLAWAFTNFNILVNDVGLYPIEARGIIQEISRRRFELFDIFFYYADGDPDVYEAFKSII